MVGDILGGNDAASHDDRDDMLDTSDNTSADNIQADDIAGGHHHTQPATILMQ